MNRVLILLLTLAFTFKISDVSARSKSKKVRTKTFVTKTSKSTRTKSKKIKKKVNFNRFKSWGVDNKQKMGINLNDSIQKLHSKKQIVVAVVDTGIDPNHPFLKTNLHTLKGSATNKNFGIDFSKNYDHKTEPHDSHGHGTHITGIIKSVFPDVKILTLKYYNPKVKNKDNLKSTIRALEYAVDKNVDIINYSSGGAGASYDELRILKKAEAKGILIIAAAGNESSNIDVKKNFYFPASYRLNNMITVINHNKKGFLNSSSNYGKDTADISAPGSRIRSSYPSGRAGYLTGTSQSTAFVSGVAALLMSKFKELSSKDIKKIIVSSAKKIKNFEKLCKSGGIIDANSAFRMASELNNKLANKLKKRKVRTLATQMISQ